MPPNSSTKAKSRRTRVRLDIAGTVAEFEGSEEFIQTQIPRLAEAFKKSHNADVKRTLLQVHEALGQDIAVLDSCSASISRLNEQLGRTRKEFFDRLMRLLEGTQECAASQPEVVAGMKQMAEMIESYNMQYLNLQQRMQDESRRFSLLSNIMKTKHDTAKNSISNIR